MKLYATLNETQKQAGIFSGGASHLILAHRIYTV